MEKREAIMKAAIKVMAAEGYYNTKMQSIADEAGIPTNIVYKYFKNKEEVIDNIFMIEFNKRIKFYEDIKNNNISYLQLISDFLMFHINELKSDPDTAKVLIKETFDTSLHKLEWINKSFIGIPNIFKEILENAKKSGEVRETVNTDTIGSIIFFTARALIYMLQVEGREREYDYTMKQFILFFINGIRN